MWQCLIKTRFSRFCPVSGRWVYRLVAAIEANTSGIGFLIFYALLVASLHFLTWLSWKAAHLAVVHIATSSPPKPKPT